MNVKEPPFPLVGAKGDGKTDDTVAIQNIIDSGAKEIIFPVGVFLISDTIHVPDYVDLKLAGDSYTWKSTNKSTVLKLANDVNLLSIGSNVSIHGGILDTRHVPNFSKSAIKIDYSGDKEITGGKINSTLIGGQFQGNGIEFYAGENGKGLIFPFYVYGSIQGFKKGIYSHKKETNNTHWFSGLFIESTIMNCETAVDLSFGGNGGRIGGSCQPLCSTGSGIGINEEPLIRVNSSNMSIEAMIWDMSTAINRIALENNGTNNILYGNASLSNNYIRDISRSPGNLRRVGISNELAGTPNSENFINKENMNGYQDNILLGAHKKFKVYHRLENTVIGGNGNGLTPNGMFMSGEETSYIALNDQNKDGNAQIEIVLDKPRGIKYIGMRFSSRPYRCKIEVYSEKTKSFITITDGLSNDMFDQTGGIDITYSWQYNSHSKHDTDSFGGNWDRQISKIRYTVYLSHSSPYGGNVNCNASVAFAYDGSLSYIPPYGGTLYGDLVMNESYIGVGSKHALPLPSETYRGCIIMIKGDGSNTGDIIYTCLMSSTGGYNWKPVISG